MQDKNKYSTKDMLKAFAADTGVEEFDAETFFKMEREIENKMEEFDLEKRKKAAIAADDLSRLVITA